MARMASTAMVALNQANSGILPSVIPRQRMHRTVAMTLIEVAMVPNPETSNASVQ